MMGMDYEVALMTTRTRPATVPVVAYFESYPNEAIMNYCACGTENAKPDYISDDAVFREGL